MRNNLWLVRVLNPYTIFFFSGLAGLIYEVVWSRQLILIFGNTTHSVVAVISAFMAGLGAGSYFFGRIADRVSDNLRLYAYLEIGVGVSGLLSLLTFALIKFSYETLLLGDFAKLAFLEASLAGSGLLFFKFLLCFLAMLPTTFLMGATLPVMVRYLTAISSNLAKEVSRLYFVNTLGAFFGVILTGFIFIETFGLRESIVLAASINLFLAAIILIFPDYLREVLKTYQAKIQVYKQKKYWETYDSYTKISVLAALGISGVVSMIYQVLWVRLLTPATGTYIYAFTIILALFLLGIALGSYTFHEVLPKVKRSLLLFGMVEIGIGLFAFSSVLLNTSFQGLDVKSKLILTILPATTLMGMTFPVVSKIFEASKKIGEDTGGIYAVNTLGSILGTLLASFFVIPTFGSAKGIVAFSLLNLFIGLVLIFRQFPIVAKKGLVSLSFIPILIFPLVWLSRVPDANLLPVELREVVSELQAKGDYEIVFKEDEVASVLGYRQKEGIDRGLLIDGMPTTYLGPETALLAHIPLTLHPDPKSILVVALGMGRTYRSALLHKNVFVDVVELVPTVPRLLYLFHDNPDYLLKNGRGRIIVNDGRNYVRTTTRKYDVIVVDPPPPVNAAGTTVLYSKEFYLDSKKILEKDGIFVAWLFAATRVDDFRMLVRSFYEAFDEILVVRSPLESGYYLIGSDTRLDWNSQVLQKKFDNLSLLEDVNTPRVFDQNGDLTGELTFEDIDKQYLGEKEALARFIDDTPRVSDNRPRTEYFLLRHMRQYEPMMWESDILARSREVFYTHE